jgi:hypothetical protein
MASRRLLSLFVLLVFFSSVVRSADRSKPERVHRISLAEYEGTLQFWQQQHPTILDVERAGLSLEGLGLYLLKITDPEIPTEEKQVCLITSLHGGPERSGTTTILHLIEWLLGDSDEAKETRRKQIVLIMPINHPLAFFETDRFLNASKIDPYTGGDPQNWDLENLEYKAADKAPEVKAVLDIVDRWQPEVHVDVHGTGLQEYPDDRLGDRTRYQGQIMFEVTGSAYSNYALRPWDWRVTEAIIQAGVDAGYPSDRFEADGQRSFHGPVMNPIADRTWRGQPNFYTAQYGYAKYHTMVMAFEVGWEQSGVARLKGLLHIGNNRWQQEPNEGYPVDRVKPFIGHFVTSWGRDAAERRRSRVELWQKQGRFTQAVLYPQTDGRDTYFIATSERAVAALSKNTDEFLAAIAEQEDIDSAAVASFVRSGPEVMLAVDAGRSKGDSAEPIQNGIGFRLRLPYQKPTITAVSLNGTLLDESTTDGYQAWQANGFTQLQIHVPPEKAAKQDLFLVTCEYQPEIERRIGWTPPPEVLQQLKPYPANE